MHYYRFNIGDYRRDTSHLSLVEHGIYRQLIDLYYLEEGPLPDKAKLMRLLCVRNAADERALDNVLNDFFKSTKTGFENTRCDEELARIYAKSEKARQSAKVRWGKDEEEQGDTKQDADAMQTHNERNANGMLPSNPVTHNKTYTSKPKVSPCPHQEIIQIYHDKLPELPKVIVSRWQGSKREKDLQARWKEDERHKDLEFWGWFFSTVKKNRFWLGENDRGWKADLGWLVKRANFDKVVERGANDG